MWDGKPNTTRALLGTTERRASWTVGGTDLPPYNFESGRAGTHPDARQYVHSLSNAGYRGAVQAFRDWRRAQWDHAETSFYGVERIRAMRHFWIGVAWGIRERGGEPPKAPCGATWSGERPGAVDCGCGWGELCSLVVID